MSQKFIENMFNTYFNIRKKCNANDNLGKYNRCFVFFINLKFASIAINFCNIIECFRRPRNISSPRFKTIAHHKIQIISDLLILHHVVILLNEILV